MRGAAGTRLGFESLEGRLLLAADYGDAPDTYGTTIAANGAYHSNSPWMLGSARDLENDAVAGPLANGDGSDDDGVTFSPLRAGSTALVSVMVTAPQFSTAELDAWIDFDGDGTFSGALERIVTSLTVDVGRNDLKIAVPSWASTGVTYARFRLSQEGVAGPLGNGGAGEVEDYAVEIAPPAASDAAFAEQVIVNGNKGASALLAVDIDADGDLDLIANDVNQNRVVWHKNNGGGEFSQVTISSSHLGTDARLAAGDHNGDGLMDVLVSRPGSTVRWLRQDSNAAFYSLSLSTGNAAVAADLLKDGRLDVLFGAANPNSFRVQYDSSANGLLKNLATGTQPGTAVDAADIDGDGDVDFLGATAGDNSVAWYEYVSAAAGYARRSIAADVAGVASASLVDLDNDGDLDVLTYAAGDGEIEWFENDGAQSFTRHLIAAISGVVEINRADVDGDGDLDLLVAAGAGGAKLLTNDGSEAFTASTLPTTAGVGIQSIVAGDFDGDGVLEIAVGGSNPHSGQSSGGYLALLRRQTALDFGDAPASYGTTLAGNGARHYPAGPTLGGTRDGEADGGSPASANGVDEDGVTFGALQVGDNSAAVVVNVQNAPAGARLDAWIDFNGDGTFSEADERIAFRLPVAEGDNVVTFAIPAGAASGETYARFRLSSVGGFGVQGGAADGEVEDYAVTINPPAGAGGIFGAGQSISSSSLGSLIHAVDFDRDGDVDVLVGGSGIRWFANNGQGQFTQVNVNIPIYGSSLISLETVDLDSDGDLDVLGYSSGVLFWNENLGNTAFRPQVLGNQISSIPLKPEIIDFDSDGDADVILGNLNELSIRIWENRGAGQFSQRILANPSNSANLYRSNAMAVVDADGDGDLDIYLAPEDYSARLVLWRNDGAGTFTQSVLHAGAGSLDRVRTLQPVDFDDDGDLDLVATIRRTSSTSLDDHAAGWYENLGNGDVMFRPISEIAAPFRQLTVGDVDGDGDFDVVTSYVSFGRIVWHENMGGNQFVARLLARESGFGNMSFYTGVALADADGDGDLDVFTASQSGSGGVDWIQQLSAAAGDYGDAPVPYPVTPSANGPIHAPVGPRLGAGRDEETAATNSPAGNGDGADDDGVTLSPFRVGELAATATINVQNAPTGARLDAWIDFDGDGNWSRAEERIAANLAVVQGNNVVKFNVPSWAVAGVTYARFRVSSAGQLGFTGSAVDGEVEDHAVTILNPTAAEGPYFEQHLISSNLQGGTFFVADIDRDGDNDVIRGRSINVELEWHENDGAGNFTAKVLPGTSNWQSPLFAAVDFDNDGDVDVVNQSNIGSLLVWFENDGQQAFIRRMISLTSSMFTKFMSMVDVEGDGDLDLLNSGVWSQRTGVNTFVSYPLNTRISPSGTHTADLDRDGDLDLLYGSYSTSSNLAWNEFSIDEFAFQHLTKISSTLASAVSAADMDDDGDLDLLIIASSGSSNVRWLENDGQMNYTERAIGSMFGNGGNVILPADVDGDGDLDVIASGLNETVFFENEGGQTFSRRSIGPISGERAVLADMNGDGKLDLVMNPYYAFQTSRSGLSWYSLTDRQVSVAAAPASIDEEGIENVVFTFTRAGATEGELTVPFMVGGDALYGVDYTVNGAASFDATAGTITFAAGVTTVEVTLTPIDDAEKEFHERATLTIPPLAGYSIANAVATATIRTAELAGDYDANGTVDGADFLAWQRSFGQTADPVGSGADGNLDGETDGDDLAVWTENFGEAIVTSAPPEVATAALVALEEEPAMATASAATASANWFGRLAGDEAAIIALPATGSAAKRVERRHDLREEAFARTSRWSDGHVGVQRYQLASHAWSHSTEDAQQGDAEAFDELASELARAWREF